MSVRIGSTQHDGSRSRQEDYFSDKKIGEMDVAVLADGMGGYEGGDQASITVTQGFISFIEQQARKYPQIPDLLVDAAFSANAQLARLKHGAESNMGSTLVAVLVRGNHAWWVSIGDSLLYLWRDGKLQKLNADHSHYQDLRQQVFLGQISTAQAANDPERDGLTSALMGRQMKHVDVSRFGIELKDGDIFLLASDGLETLFVTQGEQTAQIKSVLQRLSDPQQIADALVQQVLRVKAEHQDNVSVLTVGINLQGITASHASAESPARKNWLNNSLLMLLTGLLLGGLVSILAIQTLFKSTPPDAVKTPPLPPVSTPVASDNKGENPKPTCEDEQKRAEEVCEFVFANYSNSLRFCPDIAKETYKRCENNVSNKPESSSRGVTTAPSTEENKQIEDSTTSSGDEKTQSNNVKTPENSDQQAHEKPLKNDKNQQSILGNNNQPPPVAPRPEDMSKQQFNGSIHNNGNQPDPPVAPQYIAPPQSETAPSNNNGEQQFNGLHPNGNDSPQTPSYNSMPPIPELPPPSNIGEQRRDGFQQNQPAPQQGNGEKNWWSFW